MGGISSGYIISTDRNECNSPERSPGRPQFVNADGVKVGYPRRSRFSDEVDVNVVK